MDDRKRLTEPFVRRAGAGLGVLVGASTVLGIAPGAGASTASSTTPARPVQEDPFPEDNCPPLCSDDSPWVAPGASCPNPNPTDGYNRYKREIYNTGGTDVGDVILQYSPGARCVRAIASCVGTNAYVTAFVYKPSLNQFTSSHTAPCGGKAVTGWINDAGISQLAAGRKRHNNGNWLGLGSTPAY